MGLCLCVALGPACVACQPVSFAQRPPRPSSAAVFGRGLGQINVGARERAEERRMLELVNRYRQERGLAALQFDPRLSEIARFHSADMRDAHFFDHHSPNTGTLEDRLDAASYLFEVARENLAEARTVSQAHENLLASPPHLKNILSEDVTHFGVGVVEGGVVDARNLTVTQVFSTPAQPESPGQAKQRIVERLRSARAQKRLDPAPQLPRLARLAEESLRELDQSSDSRAVAVVSKKLVDALGPGAGSTLVSLQTVSASSEVQVPQAFLEHTVAFGLALRKASGYRGRPALQLLLLTKTEGQP